MVGRPLMTVAAGTIVLKRGIMKAVRAISRNIDCMKRIIP